MEAARLLKPKECAIAVHACDGGDGSGGSDGHGGDGDSSADLVPTSVRPSVPRHKSTEYPPSRRTTLSAKKSVPLITENSLTFAEVFADRIFVRSRRIFDLLIERSHLSIGTPMPRARYLHF